MKVYVVLSTYLAEGCESMAEDTLEAVFDTETEASRCRAYVALNNCDHDYDGGVRIETFELNQWPE